MKKLLTIFSFLLLLIGHSQAQIVIDGDMLDWVGIDYLDQAPAEEAVGEIPEYPDFDLKHLYITHDTSNVYVKIDLADGASFNNFFNYTNPPVFEFYMDTEIADTNGFDWGWWNIAMNYYIDLAPTLNPDSTEKRGFLYKYNGKRMPTYVEGEFQFITEVPLAINDDGNSLEFSIPRDSVNFGSEFRPWVYSVADFQWEAGADQLPGAADEYMLKYDFWYGGSVYQHIGPQIVSEITIDGDLLDWATAGIQPADQGVIAEELGDMATGPEFDVQDLYVTSDSTYLYVRIDIDPSATFAGMYNNYENSPAFQLMLDVAWGDTTGLGYGGFWRLPVDYMIDLSAALHPDSTGNEVPVYKYVADWMGAFEEFAPIEGVTAQFAKNDEDNVVEIAIPRTGINADTDVRPWLYVVGDENWDNEEYVPNTVVEGYDQSGIYYALNYNFINGVTAHRLGDNSLVTSVEENYKNQSLTKGFGLVSNYPNPFNPSTKIVFTLPQQDVVDVTVFDVLGRKVATLVNNQVMQSGQKTVEWNGTDNRGNQLSSGIYIYQIKSSQYQVNKKMMMLK